MAVKTWKRRTISLFCTLALCLSVVASLGVIGALAENTVDDVPAPPVGVLATMPDATDWVGDNLNWARDRFAKENFGPVDASAGRFVELDVYVSDLELLKANGWSYMRFCLASGDSRWAGRNQYDITSQITQTGWNHVKIDLDDFVVGEGMEASSIRHYMLDIGEGAAGAAKDVQISLRNICVTDWVPETAIELSTEGFDKTDLLDKLWDVSFDPALDLSEARYIEFDVYIENYAAFTDPNTNQQFWISSNGLWDGRLAFHYRDLLTGDGWNHVKVPISDGYNPGNTTAFDAGSVAALAFFSEGRVSDARLRIKNVWATMEETIVPDEPETPEDTVPAPPERVVASAPDADNFGWVMGSDFNAHSIYAFNMNGFTPMDATKGEYIEFDFYVEDYALAKEAGMGAIMFGISSGENWGASRSVIQIEEQITKSGWNHVKFAWSDMNERDGGQADFTGLKNYMFEISGDASGAADGMKFAFANLCVTADPEPDPADDVPAPPANVVVMIDREGFENDVLKDMIYLKDMTGSPVDISKAEYLEFDVYVDNYAAIASTTNQGFSLSSGPSQWDFRAHYIYTDYLYADGWNHVRIPVDGMVRYENGNITDMSAVTFLLFYTEAAAAPEGARLVMANFCATNADLSGDTQAPAFDSAISAERQEEKGITIGWSPARDDVSMKPEITYTAYYSESPITAENLAAATPFATGKNIHSATVRGLESNTEYYFAVTASDAAGNKTTVFGSEPISTTQKTDTLTVFEGVAAEIERGDLDTSGDFNAVSKTFYRNPNAPSGWENNIILRHAQVADYRDISSYNALSVDVYIDNIDRYNSIWKNHTYLILKSGTKGEDGYQTETFPLKDFDLQQGWNTVVLDLSGSHVNLTEVSRLLLATFPLDNTDLGYYPPDELGECEVTFKLANIKAVDIDDPVYSLTEMENERFLLYGGSFILREGYGADHPDMRVLQYLASPVDISAADYVEFDFYIENLQAVIGQEGVVGLKLRLLSGDQEFVPALRLDFTDQVTHNGWNHIKIALEDGMPEDNWDSTNMTGMRLYVEGSTFSPAIDVKMAFKNLYATAKTVIEYPKDEDQPSRPDQDSLYISDCEALAVGGTWNPAGVWVDTDNKTEGKASIGQVLKDQSLRANSMRFILTDPLDLSRGSTLKFDLWVSDPELLRQRATMSVRLTSDSRGYDDYFNWTLDLSGVKAGWNSFEIDLSKGYTTDGDPDLSAIRVFHLLCDDASFSAENEEEVIIKVDNVRVGGIAGGAATGVNFPLLPIAVASLAVCGLGLAAGIRSRKKA